MHNGQRGLSAYISQACYTRNMLSKTVMSVRMLWLATTFRRRIQVAVPLGPSFLVSETIKSYLRPAVREARRHVYKRVLEEGPGQISGFPCS